MPLCGRRTDARSFDLTGGMLSSMNPPEEIKELSDFRKYMRSNLAAGCRLMSGGLTMRTVWQGQETCIQGADIVRRSTGRSRLGNRLQNRRRDYRAPSSEIVEGTTLYRN